MFHLLREKALTDHGRLFLQNVCRYDGRTRTRPDSGGKFQGTLDPASFAESPVLWHGWHCGR